MYISSFSIENYKSYLKTEVIELKPGFNLFVGKNNAGKTSLLEAISCKFENKPHLSITSVLYPGYIIKSRSRTNFEFALDQAKLEEWLFTEGREFYIPKITSAGLANDSDHIRMLNSTTYNFKKLRISFLKEPSIITQAYVTGLTNGPTSVGVSEQMISTKYEVHEGLIYKGTIGTNSINSLWFKLSNRFISQIYCFKAERFNVGECAFGHSNILRANSENLPEVLNSLQTNSSKFERFNKYVNQIFPQIYRVTIKPKQNNTLEILTWTIDPKTERQDLAIPLSESGTGVGQVLAMLYVILERDPQIIIIDELQSFLHPGAVRKLIEIFKENIHHQYIIATHSPIVISATNPETITLIQHEGSETKLKSINKNEASQLSEFLNDIGARLSDVFGADNILWVEGPTEERCIPMIIERLMEKALMGTNVIGVVNTGDLEGRDKKRIYKIYSKLSTSNSLMPPSIGFMFDREGKKDQEIEALEKESKGLVQFVSRRMYENYLLNSEAITFVINNIDEFSSAPISKESVEEWIDKNKAAEKYWKDGSKFSEYKDDWRRGIHAAEFLGRIFYELSEGRVTYKKTDHSVRLTEWIIENSTEDFKELTELLKVILDRK